MARRTSAGGLADEYEATGARRRWLTAARLFLLIAGGYVAASTLVAGMACGLAAAGLARGEAVVLASMCGFGFYLVLLIWGFSQVHLTRLVLGFVLAGGVGLALMMITRT